MKPGATTHDLDEARAAIIRGRLRGASRTEALDGIREIVSNLLGSEEMALFRMDRGKRFMRMIWSFGINPRKHQRLDARHDPVVAGVLRGRLHIQPAGGSELFSALVPIRRQGQTVAILAILRLLPQKPRLVPADVELLHVLSHEAGMALFGEGPESLILAGEQ